MPTLKETLYDEFLKYGKIISIRLDGDKKCCFIFFKHSNQAQTAVEALNEKQFNNLTVLKCEKIDFSTYLSQHSQNVSQQTLIQNLNQEQELDEYCSKATRTLYIGNLDRDVKHSDLREKLDKKYGDIIEIEIKKDMKKPTSVACSGSSSNSANNPYAFIQFSDIRSVIKAMRCMNGKCIGQNLIKLGFGKSKPTKTLWLDGISDQLKESHLKEFFRTHCENVIEQILIDRNKCQALVYFSVVEDAKNCAERIRAKRFYDKKIMVDFASKEFISSRFEHLLDPKHHLFTNHNRLKPDLKVKRARSPRSNSLNDSRSSSSSSSSSTSSSASTEATPNTTRSESVDSAAIKNEEDDKKRHYYDDQYPIDDLSHVLNSSSQKYKFYQPSNRNQHSPSDLSHLLNDSPNHYRRYFNEPPSYHHHRHYYEDRGYRSKYYSYHVDKSSSSTSLNPSSYSSKNHKESSRKIREKSKAKSEKKKSKNSKVSSSSSRSSLEEAKKKRSQSRSLSSDSSSSISSVSNTSSRKNTKKKPDRDDINPQPMDVETPDESEKVRSTSQPNTPQVANSSKVLSVTIPLENSSNCKDPRFKGTDSSTTYLSSHQFNQEIEIPKFGLKKMKKNVDTVSKKEKSPDTIQTNTNTIETKTMSPSNDRRSLEERIKMLDEMMEQQKSKQISNDLLSTTSSLSNKFSSSSTTQVLKQPFKLSKLFDADEQRLNQSSNFLSQKLANSPLFSKVDSISMNLAPPGVAVYDQIKLISQVNKSPKLVLPTSNPIVAHAQNSSPTPGTPSTPTSVQIAEKLGLKIKGCSSLINFGNDSPTVSAIASTSSTTISSPTISNSISPPLKSKDQIKSEPIDVCKNDALNQKINETKSSTTRPELEEEKINFSKVKIEPEFEHRQYSSKPNESEQKITQNVQTKIDMNSTFKNQTRTDSQCVVKCQPKLEANSEKTKPIVEPISDLNVHKNESNAEVKSHIKTEPVLDVKYQSKIELNNDNKSQTKTELNTEAKINAKNDGTKSSIKTNNETKIQNKHSEINTESKCQLKADETRAQIKQESNSESKILSKTNSNADTKSQNKPDLTSDSKNQSKTSVSSESKSQTKSDLHSDAKAKTDANLETKSQTKVEHINQVFKTQSKTDTNSECKSQTKNESDSKQNDRTKIPVSKQQIKKPESKQLSVVKNSKDNSKETKSPMKNSLAEKTTGKSVDKLTSSKPAIKSVSSDKGVKKTLAVVKKEIKTEPKCEQKTESKSTVKVESKSLHKIDAKSEEKKKELNKKPTDLNDLYDSEESDSENKSKSKQDKLGKKSVIFKNKNDTNDKKSFIKKNINDVKSKSNKLSVRPKIKEDAKSKCDSSSDSSSDSSDSGSDSSEESSSESSESEDKRSKNKHHRNEKKKLSKKEKRLLLKKKSHNSDSSDNDEHSRRVKKKKSSSGINRELAFLIENKDALAYSGSLYDRVKARPRQADTKKKKRKNKKSRKIIVQSDHNVSGESKSSESDSSEPSSSSCESDSKSKVKNRIESSSDSDTESKKCEVNRKRQKSTDSLFDSEETVDSKKEVNKVLVKPSQTNLIKRCRTDSTASSTSSTTKNLGQELSAKKRKLPDDDANETNPCKTPKSSATAKTVAKTDSVKSVKTNLESKMKKPSLSLNKQEIKNETKLKVDVKKEIKKESNSKPILNTANKLNKVNKTEIKTELKNEKIEQTKCNLIKKEAVKVKKQNLNLEKKEQIKEIKHKDSDSGKTSLSSGSSSSIGHCVDEESLTLTKIINETESVCQENEDIGENSEKNTTNLNENDKEILNKAINNSSTNEIKPLETINEIIEKEIEIKNEVKTDQNEPETFNENNGVEKIEQNQVNMPVLEEMIDHNQVNLPILEEKFDQNKIEEQEHVKDENDSEKQVTEEMKSNSMETDILSQNKITEKTEIAEIETRLDEEHDEHVEKTINQDCSTPKQQFVPDFVPQETNETMMSTSEPHKAEQFDDEQSAELTIQTKPADLDSTQDYSSETIEMNEPTESKVELNPQSEIKTDQNETDPLPHVANDNFENESKNEQDLLKIEPSINLLKQNEPKSELDEQIKQQSKIEIDMKQENETLTQSKLELEHKEEKNEEHVAKESMTDLGLNQESSSIFSLSTVSPNSIQFNPTQMDLNSAMSLTASLNNLNETKQEANLDLDKEKVTNEQVKESVCEQSNNSAQKTSSNMDMLLEAIMVDQPKNVIDKKSEKHNHHHHNNNHQHHHHHHHHNHHHNNSNKHNKSDDKQEKIEKQSNTIVESKSIFDTNVNIGNYVPPNFGSFLGSPSTTPQKNSFAYSMPFILGNTPKSKEEPQQSTITPQNPFSIQSHLKRSSPPATQSHQFVQPTVPNLNSLDNWQAAYTKYPLTFLAPPPQYQQQQQQHQHQHQHQQQQQQQGNKTKQSPSSSPSPKVTTPKPVPTTPLSASETSIFPGYDYLDKMHLLLPHVPAQLPFNPLVSTSINQRPVNSQQTPKQPIQNMSVTSTTPSKHSCVKPGKKQIAKEYEQQQQQQQQQLQQQQQQQQQQQSQQTPSQIIAPNTLPNFSQFPTAQSTANNPAFSNYYSPFNDLRFPFLFAAAAAHNQFPDLANTQSNQQQQQQLQQPSNTTSQPNFKPNMDYMSQMMMSSFPNVYNDNRQSNQFGNFLSSQLNQFGQNAYLNQEQKKDETNLFTGYTEFQDRNNIIWYGSFTIKNDTASIGMNFVAGNMEIAKSCLGQMSLESNNTPLRILQRMRLEQSQLEGVQRKLQLENEHCILIAVPYGANMLEQMKQTNNLKNGFINYLLEKKAAGIVNVNVPNTSYVVHIFPPCDFTSDIMRKRAPEMSKKLGDYTHLFIVIATV